jgi:N-acylneuraminate cytidylyltransferase
MKYISIIPARSGSKRLPAKNIMLLDGKPLIAHSIIYSRQEIPNAEVYVSTDGQEIASVAMNFGTKIIMRPAELSDDYAITADVLQHAATEILRQGLQFDYIILLQATNPIRPQGLLRQAISIIESEQYDSLITVSPLVKKIGKICKNQFIPWNYRFGQRSQEIEPLYYENGLLYISKKELILDGRILGDNTYSMIVDHIYGTVDIDTKEDFYLAEFYINSINNE